MTETTKETTKAEPSSKVTEKFKEGVDEARLQLVSDGETVTRDAPPKESGSRSGPGRPRGSKTRKKSRSKKTTSRRSSAKSAPEQTDESFKYVNEGMTKMIAGMLPFGILAAVFADPMLNITDEEKDFLVIYWDLFFQEYAPAVVESGNPAYMLLGAIGLVAAPKFHLILRDIRRKKAEVKHPEKSEPKKSEHGIKGYEAE